MTVGWLSKSCWAGGGGDNGERGKPKGSNRRGKLWLSPWGQSYPPATYTGTRGGSGGDGPKRGEIHTLKRGISHRKGKGWASCGMVAKPVSMREILLE